MRWEIVGMSHTDTICTLQVYRQKIYRMYDEIEKKVVSLCIIKTKIQNDMKKIILLTLIFTSIMVVDAMAWGGFGHRSIAELAERNLTPEAKANIEKYTKGTPLADYAVWMDMVRKESPKDAHATRGWHASIVNAECKTSQEIRDKYRQGRDAVTGILEFEKQFANRDKMSDEEVMFAIKCIVHMVADMHCPAHVRFTDFENQGKFPLRFFGKKSTLHKVWDTSVLTRDHKGWSYREYAQKLDKLSKGKIKRITNGWVEDWLEESGRVVRPIIYDVKEGDALDDEFMTWAYPLAESQARKAGYRLARVLNVFFK